MKRIVRSQRLSNEESLKYQSVRNKIAEELPDLIARHHERRAGSEKVAKKKRPKKVEVVWTKQCRDGRACARIAILKPGFKKAAAAFRKALREVDDDVSKLERDMSTAAFVPDDQAVCDRCLIAKYELEWVAVEGDYLSSCDAYTKESVVKALRLAEEKGKFDELDTGQ